MHEYVELFCVEVNIINKLNNVFKKNPLLQIMRRWLLSLQNMIVDIDRVAYYLGFSKRYLSELDTFDNKVTMYECMFLVDANGLSTRF